MKGKGWYHFIAMDDSEDGGSLPCLGDREEKGVINRFGEHF